MNLSKLILNYSHLLKMVWLIQIGLCFWCFSKLLFFIISASPTQSQTENAQRRLGTLQGSKARPWHQSPNGQQQMCYYFKFIPCRGHQKVSKFYLGKTCFLGACKVGQVKLILEPKSLNFCDHLFLSKFSKQKSVNSCSILTKTWQAKTQIYLQIF